MFSSQTDFEVVPGGHPGTDVQQVERNGGWNSGKMIELEIQIYNYLYKVNKKLKKRLW